MKKAELEFENGQLREMLRECRRQLRDYELEVRMWDAQVGRLMAQLNQSIRCDAAGKSIAMERPTSSSLPSSGVCGECLPPESRC